MENPGFNELLWPQLNGGLWHATRLRSLQGIIRDGAILPSFGERYTTGFCRSLNAVSLFDFGQNAENRQAVHNCFEWVGNGDGSYRTSVWLRIDRPAVGSSLLDAKAARQKWDNTPRKFIAGVEACHYGRIPIRQINGFLLIACNDTSIFSEFGRDWVQKSDEFEAFNAGAPEEPDSLAKTLRMVRSRASSMKEE